MLYLVHWSIDTEHRDAATSRFMSTGAPPPAGVTMVGRWHAIEGLRGTLVAEADDPVAIGRWCHAWTDHLVFEVVPVVDDAGVQRILGE